MLGLESFERKLHRVGRQARRASARLFSGYVALRSLVRVDGMPIASHEVVWLVALRNLGERREASHP